MEKCLAVASSSAAPFSVKSTTTTLPAASASAAAGGTSSTRGTGGGSGFASCFFALEEEPPTAPWVAMSGTGMSPIDCVPIVRIDVNATSESKAPAIARRVGRGRAIPVAIGRPSSFV